MTKTTFKTIFENAESVDGWAEPDMQLIEGYRQPAMAFPVQLFGDFWSQWLVSAAESKSAPVDYVAAGLMTSAAALIGNARFVTPWDGWAEPPIFWACCIGLPSSGKTPAINAAMDLMREIEVTLNPDFDDRCKEYEQLKAIANVARKELEAEIKKARKNGSKIPPMPDDALEPEKPSKRRIVIMDTTVEIIAPMISKSPKGLMCFRDELAGWLGSMNQYKGGSGPDRAFYLESYNGKSYTVDRVKWGLEGSLTVPRLSISIIGGIQPDRFVQAVLSDADDGISARFTYYYPESVPPKRPVTRPDDARALAALRKLQELQFWNEKDDKGEQYERPFYIPLEERAANALDKLRQDIHEEEKSVSGHYLSYLGKNPGKALRIALIIEFLHWAVSEETRLPESVSEKSMLSALGLITEYFDPMARRAFDDAALPEETRNAVSLAKWIIRNKLQDTSTRDIQRLCLKGCKADKIDAAVAELVAANWLAPAPDNDATGGRPKKDFLVNPKIWLAPKTKPSVSPPCDNSDKSDKTPAELLQKHPFVTSVAFVMGGTETQSLADMPEIGV